MSRAAQPPKDWERVTPQPDDPLVAFAYNDAGEQVGDWDFSTLQADKWLLTVLAVGFRSHAGYGGSWNSGATCNAAFYSLKTIAERHGHCLTNPPLTADHWESLREAVLSDEKLSSRSAQNHLAYARAVLAGSQIATAEFNTAAQQKIRDPGLQDPPSVVVLSPEEFDEVQAEARKVLLAARQRIRSGWALANAETTSEKHLQRATLAEELSHLAAHGDVSREVFAYPARPGHKPVHYQSGRVKHLGGVGKVAKHLFLTQKEAAICSVLLVGQAGLNRSVAAGLPFDGEDPTAGLEAFQIDSVETEKPRRGRNSFQRMNFVSGPGNGDGAFQLIREATQGGRDVLETLGHPTRDLFVYWSGKRNADGIRLRTGIPESLYLHQWVEETWGEDSGMTVTLPILRRTWQVVHEQPNANSMKVHVEVYRGKSESEKALSRRRTAKGLESAESQALVNHRMRVEKNSEAAGETTVLGNCTDFHDSPHTAQGEPCQASFLTCLQCPNAVAMPVHLPVQVATFDALEELRSALDSAVWSSRFKQSFLALADLLDRNYSDAELKNAKSDIEPKQRQLVADLLAGRLECL